MTTHPQARYLERYGVPLSDAGMRAIEVRLSAGEGMLLRREPDGSEVRVVSHNGKLIVAVCGASGRLKTFLPADTIFARSWRRRLVDIRRSKARARKR